MKWRRSPERDGNERTAQKSVAAASRLKDSQGPSWEAATMPVASAAGGAHSAAPPALTAVYMPVALPVRTAQSSRSSVLPETRMIMIMTSTRCATCVTNESAVQYRLPARAGLHRWRGAAAAIMATD
ncbi:hypothetical protein D9M72_474890 [compost metagenome]